MRSLYFDKQGTPISAAMWAKLWEDWSYRCVADERVGNVRVATIWEGIDHDLYGEPHIFETMIFGGRLDQESQRYRTLKLARIGHQIMVARVRAAEGIAQ